mmetsp:Transcript_94807/g.263366  ORF Transcript_94807/g.263366 Transcript_94807/m.263366 type:complete len:358 (+) Transcript_94807:813-1886(+)
MRHQWGLRRDASRNCRSSIHNFANRANACYVHVILGLGKLNARQKLLLRRTSGGCGPVGGGTRAAVALARSRAARALPGHFAPARGCCVVSAWRPRFLRSGLCSCTRVLACTSPALGPLTRLGRLAAAFGTTVDVTPRDRVLATGRRGVVRIVCWQNSSVPEVSTRRSLLVGAPAAPSQKGFDVANAALRGMPHLRLHRLRVTRSIRLCACILNVAACIAGTGPTDDVRAGDDAAAVIRARRCGANSSHCWHRRRRRSGMPRCDRRPAGVRVVTVQRTQRRHSSVARRPGRMLLWGVQESFPRSKLLLQRCSLLRSLRGRSPRGLRPAHVLHQRRLGLRRRSILTGYWRVRRSQRRP